MLPKPIVLIILDGFGYRASTENNAIATAHTPCWDKLWQTYPHALLSASGVDVGLPVKQMGNSEVGHFTLGAGRVLYQDLSRISKAILEGEFHSNAILNQCFAKALALNSTVHVLGLLSPGGVHSHETHIQALIQLASTVGVPRLAIHAFLDGRDVPPKSAAASLAALEAYCQEKKLGHIASIMGRYYAMDRDNRWERTQKAYELLTRGKTEFCAKDASTALAAAYSRGETDEFVEPTLIGAPTLIQNNDIVIFMNFRADRARQLSRALTHLNFSPFPRTQRPQLGEFVTLCEYAEDLNAKVVFPTEKPDNTLGEVLEKHGRKQLRIAETEKYAHVTFFLNGGREHPFTGETRILIPSPKTATYDVCPEMSAIAITEHLLKAIYSQDYDVIICNFANADMLGHTGHFQATVAAIETLDTCLDKIINALKAVGGEAIITADHGNAEVMFDAQTKQAHTAHTAEPVPFLYIGRKATLIKPSGTLADVAPTLLLLLGIQSPLEMTGRPLVKLCC